MAGPRSGRRRERRARRNSRRSPRRQRPARRAGAPQKNPEIANGLIMTGPKTVGFASGFVSILGRPNVGKSTLMNALIGTKVAIVSSKPQTTRTGIQGVLTLPAGQIVFADTPGIHKARSSLNRRMMDSVREALDQRDLLLYVADSTAPFTTADREALDMVKKSQTPAFLVLNKIDLLRDKTALLPLIERYRAAHDFAEYFPI